MNKLALFVFSDPESKDGLGRVVKALETAKELKDENVRLYFDGAGTRWLDELTKPNHMAHKLFQSVTDKVTGGACSFCAATFGVTESVKKANVELMSEYDDHISVKKLLSEGYQILNF